MIVLVSCFVLSFENLDDGTTLGTVMAMISNTGLVMGPSIGFSDTLAGFSQFSYLYMSLLMLAGRLELFTVILLLTPSFWRETR
jgi:trk system potassium uptake protein TrkH